MVRENSNWRPLQRRLRKSTLHDFRQSIVDERISEANSTCSDCCCCCWTKRIESRPLSVEFVRYPFAEFVDVEEDVAIVVVAVVDEAVAVAEADYIETMMDFEKRRRPTMMMVDVEKIPAARSVENIFPSEFPSAVMPNLLN